MQQAELRREPDQQQSCCIQATKRCGRCKKVYPAFTDFFHRDNSRPDGLYSYCKSCNRQTNHKVVQEGRSHKIPEYDADRLWRHLRCEKCHDETRHIYCQSRISKGKTVYACFSCGEENARAS